MCWHQTCSVCHFFPFFFLLLLVGLYSCRLCRLVQGLVLMALVLPCWWCDVAFVLSVKMQFCVCWVCVCWVVLCCVHVCECVCMMHAQFACRMFNISDEIIKWSWIDSRMSSTHAISFSRDWNGSTTQNVNWENLRWHSERAWFRDASE